MPVKETPYCDGARPPDVGNANGAPDPGLVAAVPGGPWLLEAASRESPRPRTVRA